MMAGLGEIFNKDTHWSETSYDWDYAIKLSGNWAHCMQVQLGWNVGMVICCFS